MPEPAGPMPNVMVLSSIASTYARWPAVFGRMTLPRREMISSPKMSATDPGASDSKIRTA